MHSFHIGTLKILISVNSQGVSFSLCEDALFFSILFLFICLFVCFWSITFNLGQVNFFLQKKNISICPTQVLKHKEEIS